MVRDADFAPEAAGGLREAHHQGRELRISQPMRHGLAQHAALVLLVEARALPLIHALARDHQHVLEPLRLRGLEEAAELRVRVALAHAMQVEPCFDLELALVELTRGLPVERRGAWHMSGFRRGLRHGLRQPRGLRRLRLRRRRRNLGGLRRKRIAPTLQRRRGACDLLPQRFVFIVALPALPHDSHPRRRVGAKHEELRRRQGLAGDRAGIVA